ncbi:MAG TPA: CYTH and CHAD domain-containing protein [Streptosporangiaceae bacterium]
MAVSVNETEAKYEAEQDTVLPALDDVPQVASTVSAAEQLLVAVYYDTPDLRLLRAGITLRRRTGGEDAGWHLKLPVSGRTREEIRLPLDAARQRVPRELADLVRARSRGAALVPVATVSTRRQTVNLLDTGGRVLAEVADDRVSAQRQQDPSSADSWREVEVELAAGDADLLMAVDEVMRRHGLNVSARSAKLERVLSGQLPTPARPPRLTAAAPAHQVLISYLTAQAEELAALDPLVRRFSPDSVHRMRIATRRLRSTLRTFSAVISVADTEHVAAELKWLGDVLGRARDTEVLAAHLHGQQELTDVAQLLGPVAARIDSHFAAAGAAARTAVLRALKSQRYLALLTDLDALIADPPLGPAGDAAAGPALAAAVARSYRTTRRRMRRALAALPGPDRDAAFHQARKAAKRARYAAEAATAVAGHDARRLAAQMKKLQSVLGDHQDTVIARQLERRLGVSAHLAGENAFSYGLFYERDACDARLLQDLAAVTWRQASRRRYRNWL